MPLAGWWGMAGWMHMEPRGTAPLPPLLPLPPPEHGVLVPSLWSLLGWPQSAGQQQATQAKRLALREGGQPQALRTDMSLQVRGISYSHSIRCRQGTPPAILARPTLPAGSPLCPLPALPPPTQSCPKPSLKGGGRCGSPRALGVKERSQMPEGPSQAKGEAGWAGLEEALRGWERWRGCRGSLHREAHGVPNALLGLLWAQLPAQPRTKTPPHDGLGRAAALGLAGQEQ